MDWNKEIEELEKFFEGKDIPDVEIKLDKGSLVMDVQQFAISHLSVLRANKNKEAFLPYMNRLKLVREKINGWDDK